MSCEPMNKIGGMDASLDF
jgi:hypothetical protein